MKSILFIIIGLSVSSALFSGVVSHAWATDNQKSNFSKINSAYYSFVKARDHYYNHESPSDRSGSELFLAKMNTSGEQCLKEIQSGHESGVSFEIEQDIKNTMSWSTM